MFSQVNAAADVQSNGTFSFFGSETGSDFADFLLGVPSFYKQGDAQPFYMRNHYGALFAEDSWRVRRRLTLNYGVRWDADYAVVREVQPDSNADSGRAVGGVSGSADGLGLSRRSGSGAVTCAHALEQFFAAARSGMVAAGRQRPFAHTLFGDADRTSIRVGAGRFFSAIEGVSAGVMAGDPPYGSTYISPAPPLFSDPFITASTGYDNRQRFPIHFPPLNASASNPDSSVNWAPFLPVSGLPGYKPDSVTPYSTSTRFPFSASSAAIRW